MELFKTYYNDNVATLWAAHINVSSQTEMLRFRFINENKNLVPSYS